MSPGRVASTVREADPSTFKGAGRIWGVLVYLQGTYPAFTPYAKGFHLKLTPGTPTGMRKDERGLWLHTECSERKL
jgi:hypothetical protein